MVLPPDLGINEVHRSGYNRRLYYLPPEHHGQIHSHRDNFRHPGDRGVYDQFSRTPAVVGAGGGSVWGWKKSGGGGGISGSRILA